MKTRPLVLLGALVLALTPVILAGPVQARPGWLAPLPVLGGHVTAADSLAVAVAPSGRTVMAHLTSSGEGAVEVQVREPGRRLSSVRTLQASAAAVSPQLVRAAAGADGTLGVLWTDGQNHNRVAFLRPGRTTWTAPRTVPSTGFSRGRPVIDGAGRMWFATASSTAVLQVHAIGASGPVRTTTLTAPAGEAYIDQPVSLVVMPNGVARTVVLRELVTGSPGGVPGECTIDTRVVTADVPLGRPTPTRVRTLSTYQQSGFGFATVCFSGTGPRPTQPQLVRTPSGTTMTYTVDQSTDPVLLSFLTSWDRGAGAPAWGTPAEAGLVTEYLQTHLLAVGRRLVAVARDGSTTPATVGILVRQPGGAWGTWRTVTGAGGGEVPAADAGPRGGVIAWAGAQDDTDLQMRRLSAGAALSPITDLAADPNDRVTAAAVDGQGSAVVGLARYDGSVHHPALRVFDAAGPRVVVRVPARAVVGRTVRAGTG